MLKRPLALYALLFIVGCTHHADEKKITSPYDHVAIVTNTINWPYDSKTFGNDSFQLGGHENADTLILEEVKKQGLNFPADLEFGVACSAYQYEGNRVAPTSNDGIGWSIWDVFSEKGSWLNPKGTNINEIPPTGAGNGQPGETVPNGSVAIDGFHKYKEDIQLVKDLGVTTYRLSISWPRLFPHAGMKMEEANKEGIDYYTAVLEEVKRQGLTPLITLYHWDLPAWLYNFGDVSVADKDKTYGWLDMRDAKENLALIEFQKYAAAVYQHFGQYTTHFSTFNEPLTFTNSAFVLSSGNQAPGTYGYELLQIPDPDKKKPVPLGPEWFGSGLDGFKEHAPYLQAINIIKAHDIAYKTIHAIYDDETKRKEFNLQKPQVSIVLNSDWAEPFRLEGCTAKGKWCKYNEQDIQASLNQMDYMLGWWLHPVMFGSFPASMDKVYKDRIKTGLGQFEDSSCLQKEGKPVECNLEDKTQVRLTDDIRQGGTLDELAINHYTGYFVVDMDYAKRNFGTDLSQGKVPPSQYGSDPHHLARGWDSDQDAFTTQFRYLNYGDHGPIPAASTNPESKRAYVIGSAGAQPWLRQTWFVYRKLMQYINFTYLHSREFPNKQTKADKIPFADLAI